MEDDDMRWRPLKRGKPKEEEDLTLIMTVYCGLMSERKTMVVFLHSKHLIHCLLLKEQSSPTVDNKVSNLRLTVLTQFSHSNLSNGSATIV